MHDFFMSPGRRWAIWPGDTLGGLVERFYFSSKKELEEMKWAVPHLCRAVWVDNRRLLGRGDLGGEVGQTALDSYVGDRLDLRRRHLVPEKGKELTPGSVVAMADVLVVRLRACPIRLRLRRASEAFVGDFEVAFRDPSGEPDGEEARAPGSYVVINDSTDADGIAEFEVPVDAEQVSVSFAEVEVPLVVATCQPPSSVLGHQARLKNLGFELGRVDGEEAGLTTSAKALFGQTHGLSGDVSGKLQSEYGM